MEESILSHINLEHEFRYISARGLAHTTVLCDLMSAQGSDKGKGFHNYTIVYDWLFSRFRKEALHVFELGLGTNKPNAPSSMGPNGRPGASLRGWREYFSAAEIFGADVDSDILFEEDRIRTFWTDQRDPKAIRYLWSMLPAISFDIMVDDGLHEAPANICFFLESLSKLKPGGIYIVEDIAPGDVEMMNCFVRAVSCGARSVVFELLDHPVNRVDNRLMIYQKY